MSTSEWHYSYFCGINRGAYTPIEMLAQYSFFSFRESIKNIRGVDFYLDQLFNTAKGILQFFSPVAAREPFNVVEKAK